MHTYTIFAYLLNTNDRIKHEVTSLALKKIGAPDRHIKWDEKLHNSFSAIFKIDKEEIKIESGCGI